MAEVPEKVIILPTLVRRGYNVVESEGIRAEYPVP